MKPVDQTTFGVPGGNCFSACIASILELPIDDVPYFMGETSDDWDDRSGERINAFLARHGFYAITFKASGGWEPKTMLPGYCILGGQSPRGPHAVVGFAGKAVHDPHPSRAGIGETEEFTLLIPIDPARRP